MKSSTSSIVAVVAGSFLGLAGLILYVATQSMISRQMAALLVVALLGFYVGFGILIGVYRLISKLD